MTSYPPPEPLATANYSKIHATGSGDVYGTVTRRPGWWMNLAVGPGYCQRCRVKLRRRDQAYCARCGLLQQPGTPLHTQIVKMLVSEQRGREWKAREKIAQFARRKILRGDPTGMATAERLAELTRVCDMPIPPDEPVIAVRKPRARARVFFWEPKFPLPNPFSGPIVARAGWV